MSCISSGEGRMDKPSSMLGRPWTTLSRSLTKTVSQLSDSGPVKAPIVVSCITRWYGRLRPRHGHPSSLEDHRFWHELQCHRRIQESGYPFQVRWPLRRPRVKKRENRGGYRQPGEGGWFPQRLGTCREQSTVPIWSELVCMYIAASRVPRAGG